MSYDSHKDYNIILQMQNFQLGVEGAISKPLEELLMKEWFFLDLVRMLSNIRRIKLDDRVDLNSAIHQKVALEETLSQ